MYLVTQSKKGISSIELGRRLGVTQTTAWTMKHKLAQVMIERNGAKRLNGNVQMDDAYIGGERSGKHGRGAAGKTPFVAAVATTEDGKPDQIILRRVIGFRKVAIGKPTSTALTGGANVITDALACFTAVTTAGCTHTQIQTGSGAQAAKKRPSNGSTPSLETSSRLWSEPTGPCTQNTCRDISPSSNIGSTADTASRLIPRLAYVALRTAPMPYSLLKLADVYA